MDQKSQEHYQNAKSLIYLASHPEHSEAHAVSAMLAQAEATLALVSKLNEITADVGHSVELPALRIASYSFEPDI